MTIPMVVAPQMTLRERAIAAADRAEAERAACESKERADAERRARESLAEELRGQFGIEEALIGDDGVAQYEGLWFQMQQVAWDDRRRYRLHVLVSCKRDCGKPLWVEVHGLLSLGYLLNTEHTHDFGCLQQFDENGDATTDYNGNPLPPKVDKPRVPSIDETLAQSLRALIREEIVAMRGAE
jgi:hypothetical protein